MVRGSASIKVLSEGQSINLFSPQPAQGGSGAAPTTRWCLVWVMEASEWLQHLSVTAAASSQVTQAQTLIRLGSRKNITERVVRHWYRMLRNAVESPPLEVFRKHEDVALGNVAWW